VLYNQFVLHDIFALTFDIFHLLYKFDGIVGLIGLEFNYNFIIHFVINFYIKEF
jgi:hypothetical protein